MASRATRALLFGATALSGLLAGGSIDRAFVQMPAFTRLGAEAWAAYSRQADLGPGLFLYPAEGIGAAFLTIAAAISFMRDGRVPRRAALPIYLGAVLVIGGMLLTLRAAPIMLTLRGSADVSQAFDGFRFWGNFRGAFQFAAFFANLWAIGAINAPILSRS